MDLRASRREIEQMDAHDIGRDLHFGQLEQLQARFAARGFGLVAALDLDFPVWISARCKWRTATMVMLYIVSATLSMFVVTLEMRAARVISGRTCRTS